MTWFKVDDALHSHPKWLAASAGARALWVTAGSWSSAHLTNGQIPRHALVVLGAHPSNAAELVRLDLWEENGDGWRFHDWELYQPTAEAVEAERAASRERQKRARDKARESRRASRRDSPRESHVSDAVSHGPPDPTRPMTTGGNARTHEPPDTRPPPQRCSVHADWQGDVPACGACADARRARKAWQDAHYEVERPVEADVEDQRTAAEEAVAETLRRNADMPPVDVSRNLAGTNAARDALRHQTPRNESETRKS